MPKAISIQQPWAWLIAHGYKDIENRDWATKHRGGIFIHASKKIDKEGYIWVAVNFPHIPLPAIDKLETGGVVAHVELFDCVESSNSPWFFGKYGFRLRDVTSLAFSPSKGQLGIFNI